MAASAAASARSCCAPEYRVALHRREQRLERSGQTGKNRHGLFDAVADGEELPFRQSADRAERIRRLLESLADRQRWHGATTPSCGFQLPSTRAAREDGTLVVPGVADDPGQIKNQRHIAIPRDRRAGNAIGAAV